MVYKVISRANSGSRRITSRLPSGRLTIQVRNTEISAYGPKISGYLNSNLDTTSRGSFCGAMWRSLAFVQVPMHRGGWGDSAASWIGIHCLACYAPVGYEGIC